MLKNLIRYGLAVAICGGAFVVSDHISQNLTRNAAIEFYAAQNYQSDRNVEFTLVGLQDYTAQAVKQASDASQFATVSVWLVSAGLVGLICSWDAKAVNSRRIQFQKWVKAVEKNDSLAIAEIETEVRSNVGSGS